MLSLSDITFTDQLYCDYQEIENLLPQRNSYIVSLLFRIPADFLIPIK